jgi:hypothetical protein
MKHFSRFMYLSAVLVSTVFAQTTSTLTGTTLDGTGAAVPAAKITITNQETQLTREVVSDDGGTYNIPLLPPGQYSITVSKDGFRPIKQENVRLEVNQQARLDFTLQLGSVNEAVTVTAAAPLLDSETSAVGQVIENRQITELPLNGRNFVQLATLGPGVNGVGYSASGTIMSGSRPDDSRPASELFSNGNREGANNFLLDGTDNNDRITLSIILRPSVEGVQEFKIQTNMFSAEQGRNAGATVNVLSKSGTNMLHGSAYDFLRNQVFDAKSYFTPATQSKPAFKQNQFGGSLGGPIIKNKLFVFGNYEGFRRRQQLVSVNSVPNAAMRTGDFSSVRDIYDPFSVRAQAGTSSGYVRDPFPQRMIPATRFDSVTSRLIQAYPLGNTGSATAFANNYTTALGRNMNWDQGDLRVDYNLSNKDLIFGRFSRQDTLDVRPSTFPNSNIPGFPANPVGLGNEDTFAGESYLKAYHAVLSWTRTWTPTFVMEARMGYARFNLNFTQEGATDGAQLGEKLGVKNSNQAARADGIPIFSPANYTGIGQTRSLPILRIQNTFNPVVNFTKMAGRHTIKFGTDIRRRQLTEFQTNRGNGRFNFSSGFTTDPNNTGSTGDAMAAFLLGTANLIEQDFTLAWVGMRNTEYGFFGQDDWRVTDRLTLNLGLRWEYFSPVSEVANRLANFDVTTGRLVIAGYNGTSNTAGVKPNYDNWAPRAGFAYKIQDKTVLRGGAGVFYSIAGNGGAALRLFRQLPFGPINSISPDQFNASTLRRVQDGFVPIPSLDFATVTGPNQSGAFIAIPPDFLSGRIMQFNLQLQHEVSSIGTVFKAGYVANLGRRLDSTYNYNQQDPGPGSLLSRRPLRDLNPNAQGVTFQATDGRSVYHSLQATAEKRFSQGLSFLAAYTYSHSIDNVTTQFGGGADGPIPQDIRYRNNDRASSSFDLRHRFTTSANYELPWGKGKKWDFNNGFANYVLGGWQSNVIFTWQTGLPFTPSLATAVSNAGGSRPDYNRSAVLDNPDRALWFDTSFNTPGSAWSTPAQYTYGNGGRNVLYGPGRVNWDFSLFKNFPFTERVNLQFRTEFYNMFNTPQFGLPNATIGAAGVGSITSLSGNNRQMQFALRLSF